MTSVSALTITAVPSTLNHSPTPTHQHTHTNSTTPSLPSPTTPKSTTTPAKPHPIHLSSPTEPLYAQTLKQLADSLSLVKQPTEDRLQRLVALCPRLPSVNPPADSSAGKHHGGGLAGHRGLAGGRLDGHHLVPPAGSGDADGVDGGLFPAVTLSSAWQTLEKSLFHNQLYGNTAADITQSVTRQPHKHNSKQALQHNGDGGGSHVSVPTSIPPTPYPDTPPLIAPSAMLSLSATSPFTPHSTLDDRSQAALLALLRYLMQSHNSPHMHALLPLVLRYLLSLPYFAWHNRPPITATSTSREKKDTSLHTLFLSHHPASPFAADVLTLLIHVSIRNKGSVSLAVNSTLLLSLRQLVLLHINTPYFLSPSQSLSVNERHLLTACQYVLQGLLFALGEQSLVHDAFTARELFNLLLALLSAAQSPVFHALTLRALVLLLQSSSELFDEASLQQLTPHIHSSSTTSYKRLTSPSSSSQHYSTLILTHSLTLSLLCALHSPSLKPTTLAQYKDTLDICLNSKADEDGGVKVMVGCVDVCDCVMRGMCELARRYVDLIPSLIDTIRSIVVTSRRLAAHPKQKPLRSLFTHAIGNICNHELATGTPYATSLTRAFIQSSLSSILKEDERRDDPVYQRQLVLLLDVVAMLGREEVSGQVAGLVCQRFSGRSAGLWLIVPQLTEIALQLKSGKEVDSIVTLLINSYTNKPVPTPTLALASAESLSLPNSHSSVSMSNSMGLLPPSRAGSVGGDEMATTTTTTLTTLTNTRFTSIPPTFSHSNLSSLHGQPSTTDSAANRAALMDAIPLALCRLAQGMTDEEKRIAMMRRLMRLFSEIAYELINEQVRGVRAGAGSAGGHVASRSAGDGRVEACGALLPALASLLCAEFYHSHGNNVENVAMSALALTTRLSSSLLTSNTLASLAAMSTPSTTAVSRLTTTNTHPMHFTSSSSTSASSSQELIGVRIYSSRESNVKWFRRCWYTLTHFDFVNPRTVAPTRLAAVRAIAAHSPVLLIDNKRDYLTTELELEAKRFPSPLPLPAMQRYLTQLMPQLQPAVVGALTLPQILYLSAVYHLETIRVKSDSGYGFAPIFAYIADEDINKGGMAPAVSGIADSVYQLSMEQLATRDRTDTVRTKDELEKHTNFLLGKVCSRYASERQAATSMLKRLVSRFQSVQWSSSCLTTLLTLYHRLNDSIDTETALSPTSSLSLPFSVSPTSAASSELELPEDLALRKQIRDSLQRTAQDWLNNAHYLVPQETLTVIQSYIQSSSSSDSPASSSLLSPLSSTSSGHAGISLTLKGGQFAADMEVGLSALVASLGKKEQYLGEMRGIYLRWKYERRRDEEKERQAAGAAASVAVGGDGEGFGSMISAYLIKTGNDLLSEYRSLTCPECHPLPAISAVTKSGIPTSAINAAASTAAVYDNVCRRMEQLILHTAALLVFSTMETSITLPLQDLLHLTCKLPAQLFVPSLVSSAVFCWDWVLSAGKHMEVMLMIEMKAAWGYVIDRQLGLFGGKKQAANTFTNNAKPYSTHQQVAFVCEKHLNQLCEPYHPPSHHTPAEQLYESITPHVHWVRFLAIHFKHLASFSRDAINILASMLHKAFARSELLSSAAQSFGARFRLVALGFHLVQGGALEYRDRQLLRDRVYSVAFGWFYSRPGWYDVGSVSALKEDVDVILGVRRALQSEDKYWRADTPTAGAQTAAAATAGGVNNLYTTDATTDSRVVRLGAYRDLLLLLLAHEMERIIVWHNPGAPGHPLTNLTFTDQHLLTSQRNITAAEWQQYTHTAWTIAPILALRISQRYPTNQPITSTLRQLVKSHPEQVYDISDAVMYLVTEDNVRSNAAELRNLVYWAPTSLTNALLMFQEPYCHHRMVMEYAVHTIYSHPVDQVVFYLAQIIQSLRSDSFKLLYDFLLKSSHFSILLSHQLIWLCQAELGEVKETGKPLEMTPFRRICQSLLDTIIANFTPAERSYYRDEVGFFEQVTAISGILKPLPTKQERKAKIKAELEKVEVKKGLYLPTNPHLQVREIICKSGTPMRSAAKVPILVAFVVAEGELREDWIRNGGREEEIKRARSLSVIRAQTQHGGADGGGVGNGGVGGSALASAEERKLAKAEKSAREDDENEKVADKYPVVIDTADEANKQPIPKLLNRLPSDSSLNRHISPSSLHQPAALDDTNDTTTDGDDTHTSNPASAIQLLDSPASPAATPTFPQACIFKVGDDCRQDALALQIIQWCKTIFQMHSLPLYLYPYRVLPNRTGDDGLIGGIIECFPEVDTRILTDHGFLFLDEIEELLAAGEQVLYACFEHSKAMPLNNADAMRGSLVYRTGTLVLPYEHSAVAGPTELLDFTSDHEGMRWTKDDVVEADCEQGYVSLRVTANHNMYVQQGSAPQQDSQGKSLWPTLRDTGIDQPPQRVAASDLFEPRCDCAEHGDHDCSHSRKFVRMLACAADGRSPSDAERAYVEAHAQQRLGLTIPQLLPFFKLLGFWIGNGSMQYQRAGSECDAVCYAQLKLDDAAFLRRTVKDAGLQTGEFSFSTSQMHQADGPEVDRTLILLIVKPSWFDFFDDEFGGKYRHSNYRNPLLSFTKQGTTLPHTSATTSNVTPSSPVSIPRSPSSSLCSTASTARSVSSFSVDTVSDWGEDDGEARAPSLVSYEPANVGEDMLSNDANYPTQSGSRLPHWLIHCLTAAQLQRVIHGLWRADGATTDEDDHKRIHTADPAFREQLMQALLHCGYSPSTRFMHAAGTVRACQRQDQQVDKTVCTVVDSRALNGADAANCQPVTANVDQWVVDWTEPTTHAGQGACWPSLRKQKCITKVPYSRSRDGRIWCVTVDHPEHLIVAQRAYSQCEYSHSMRSFRHTGPVTEQSRPLVVGQCVPNAQTRDEIGRATGGSLKQYFLSRFGREESSGYQQAVRNFIMSQAAYAVTSHILQVKDRHNGNLMFDDLGHVVHIDFGFIFDISPAGNIRFERRAFKLTTEMVELMGGGVDSPLYRWFQLLVVRGFLAVREHLHEIIAIVQPMLHSSLTCFRGDSLGHLRGRFFDGRSEREAAEGMLDLIYWANNSFYTTGYDAIQGWQQGVFYYKGQSGE